MLLRRLLDALGSRGSRSRDAAPRIRQDRQPARIYAIGDVHGCLDLLLRLEAQITSDAGDVPGDKYIVMLGDLIDRGPRSAQVIDHMLSSPPSGFERICLLGNHEAMMLAFIRDPRRGAAWLDNGGRETLLSYGLPADTLLRGVAARVLDNLIASHVPPEHIEFLERLPVLLETPEAVFAHAGLRPGVKLGAQADDDLIWFRDNFESDYAEFDRPVVHGHTPRPEALVSPRRIAIDTGAYMNGTLTAVRIMPGAAPKLLSASTDATARPVRQ